MNPAGRERLPFRVGAPGRCLMSGPGAAVPGSGRVGWAPASAGASGQHHGEQHHGGRRRADHRADQQGPVPCRRPGVPGGRAAPGRPGRRPARRPAEAAVAPPPVSVTARYGFSTPAPYPPPGPRRAPDRRWRRSAAPPEPRSAPAGTGRSSAAVAATNGSRVARALDPLVALPGCGHQHVAARRHQVDVRADLGEVARAPSAPIAPTPSTPSYAAGNGRGSPLSCRLPAAATSTTSRSRRVPHRGADLPGRRRTARRRGSPRRRRGRRPSGSPGRSSSALTVRPDSRPCTTCCSLTRTGRIRAPGASPWKATAGRGVAAMMLATPVPWPAQSRAAVPARVEQVGAGQHPPGQLRVRPVHPGVDTATVTPAPVASGASRSGSYRCCGQGVAVTGRAGRERGRAGRCRPERGVAAAAGRPVRSAGAAARPARTGRAIDRDIDRLRIVSAPERDVIASSATPAGRRRPAIVILIPPCRLYAIPVACSRKGRWP